MVTVFGLKAVGSMSTLAVAATNAVGISNGNSPRQNLLLIQVAVLKKEELVNITSEHDFIVFCSFCDSVSGSCDSGCGSSTNTVPCSRAAARQPLRAWSGG